MGFATGPAEHDAGVTGRSPSPGPAAFGVRVSLSGISALFATLATGQKRLLLIRLGFVACDGNG